MSAACISQPISWLRLERYCLGELERNERSEIEQHLGSCAACRGCVSEIRAGDETPRAEALMQRLASTSTAASLRARRYRTRSLRLAALGAIAACILLLLLLPTHSAHLPHWMGSSGQLADFPPSRVAIKGGELALALVRNRGGEIAFDATSYAPQDRFQALLTCPPPERPFVELVVFQEGQSFFPLATGSAIACANQISLGAFVLSGASPAIVCVATGNQPLDRRALAQGRSSLPRDRTACVELMPVQ